MKLEIMDNFYLYIVLKQIKCIFYLFLYISNCIRSRKQDKGSYKKGS
jgi:hypothetical protein